jgi:hypothetical protein
MGNSHKNLLIILVGGMKCQTHFWKGTTQKSFQQSLVEIGSVVSEEKILLKFHPPFFLFLAWWPSWLEIWIIGLCLAFHTSDQDGCHSRT